MKKKAIQDGLDRVRGREWLLDRRVARLELQEKNFKTLLEIGSKASSGPVGAPGRLTPGLAQMAQAQIDAWCTRGDGSNTFQGRLQGISSRLNEGSEEGFILTVFFDSQTSQRLRESHSGLLGKNGTVGAGSSVTIVIEEPPST